MEFLKDDKKRGNILKVIAVIGILGFIIFLMSGADAGIYSFIIIAVLLVPVYILIPLNEDYKKRKFISKSVVVKTILRSLILTVFLVTVYMMFFQKNYNLKYTYYTALISLVLILAGMGYENIKEEYNKREKKENGKYNNWSLILSIVLIIFLSISFTSKIADRIIIPSRELMLEGMKMPDSITVNKITKDYYDNVLEFNNENISGKIDNPEEIKSILSELNSQNIKNVSGIDKLNYDRMLDDYSDQYSLYFDYGEESYGEDKLKRGYIDGLRITSEGRIFIEEGQWKDGIIFKDNYFFDAFPVNLSEDAIGMIRRVIK